MFQDNLKALRKKKGFTQEELAARLNVVRQTVSKWEKGLSVPDSELLIKLAEILEVPLSQLLGSKIEAEEQPDALAEQLSRINEQLAIKNRRAKRVWKAIAFIVGGIIARTARSLLSRSWKRNENRTLSSLRYGNIPYRNCLSQTFWQNNLWYSLTIRLFHKVCVP